MKKNTEKRQNVRINSDFASSTEHKYLMFLPNEELDKIQHKEDGDSNLPYVDSDLLQKKIKKLLTPVEFQVYYCKYYLGLSERQMQRIIDLDRSQAGVFKICKNIEAKLRQLKDDKELFGEAGPYCE